MRRSKVPNQGSLLVDRDAQPGRGSGTRQERPREFLLILRTYWLTVNTEFTRREKVVHDWWACDLC